MKIIKNSLRVFTWLLLSMLSVIFIAELALRISGKQVLFRWNTFSYQPDTLLGYRYTPHSYGIIRNPAYANPYSINKFGFPGPDFSVPKKQGTYRIILVGTSDDTGLCTNGPLNYCNILNSKLRKSFKNIEVINCSIDGTDRSMINYRFITSECLDYQPDLILFYMGEFPLIYKMRYRKTYEGIRIKYAGKEECLDSSTVFIDKHIVHQSSFTYLYDYSYIVRGIVNYYLNHEAEKDNKMIDFLKKNVIKNPGLVKAYTRGVIDNWTSVRKSKKEKEELKPKKYSERESLELLKDLNLQLSKKGIHLMLFTTYQTKNPELPKLSRKYGIPFLALDIPIKKEYTFGELDGHSTQEGHKIIADCFYKALVDSSFLNTFR